MNDSSERHLLVTEIRAAETDKEAVDVIAGYQWGRYTGANPWKIGLLLFGAGALMVAIAVLFGGWSPSSARAVRVPISYSDLGAQHLWLNINFIGIA